MVGFEDVVVVVVVVEVVVCMSTVDGLKWRSGSVQMYWGLCCSHCLCFMMGQGVSGPCRVHRSSYCGVVVVLYGGYLCNCNAEYDW